MAKRKRYFSFYCTIFNDPGILKMFFLISGALLIIASCKDVYKPRILSSPTSYLVIEGVLTVGGPSSISLSRTTTLDTSFFKSEQRANVTVEGKDNTIRQLQEQPKGIYVSPDLSLVINSEYRLRIRTSDGKEYLSDYVKARVTPAIDSVTWRQESDGLKLFANTHDATGDTRYYRWEYDETWEIHAFYDTHWIYIGGDSNIVRPRLPWEEVYIGWKFDSSKTILMASSASLSSDIIFRAPLNFIPAGDEKLSERYSILVRQYALDKPGHAFFELMKKNTEGLGTIFDPQPSEEKGNIQCVSDPGERVIGYITASTISEKRIFISNRDLIRWRYQQDCPRINIKNDPDSIRLAFQGGLSPIDFEVDYYISSYSKCTDVTLRGATLVKPSYW